MRASIDELSTIATSAAPVGGVIGLAETDSTNLAGIRAAHDGVADFTVVVAAHQRQGRGRHDRVWEAPEGSSLTFSVVLRPSLPPEAWGHLPLMVGLAVTEGLTAYAKAQGRDDEDAIGLKWPNDVLIEGKKVGGVLLETALESDPASQHSHGLVAGIGINVDWRGIARPESFADRAISLAEWLDQDVNPADVLDHVLVALYANWARLGAHPDDCVNAVRERCITLGRSVTAHGNTTVQGTAIGLTSEGHLVIMPDTVNSNDNMPVVVRAADVEHLR